MTTVVYDRRVSPEFLALFDQQSDVGVAASLVRYANEALYRVDLRFRRDRVSGREHATLYVGLTAVLNIRARKNGFVLDAHPTHIKNGRFNPASNTPMSVDELGRIWAEVELYLDRVIPIASASHGNKEGAVQAAIASHRSRERIILDREVTPSFGNTAEKQAFMAACQQPILDALDAADLGFSGAPKKLGNECDALGIDKDGRLLAIEVKPLSGGSIAWVAAQATMYARILQGWVDHPAAAGQEPLEVLRGMTEQRTQIGLAERSFDVTTPITVVPVVALQRGASAEMIRRMLQVRDVLAQANLAVPPVEIYEVNLLGELLPLDESRHADGRPRALAYAARANEAQIAWKASTADLPNDARRHGVVRNRAGADVEVEYALPREHARLNRLPEVRDQALRLFEELRITWHQGTGGGPSAHLRSSEVQCVNALGQMMSDPDRIIRAFGSALNIAKIRDFGVIDPDEAGRYLTFEFIGSSDYFNEGRGGKRSRGSQSTSVDAAFAHTTSEGEDALALVEWKFTETYPSVDRRAASREGERDSSVKSRERRRRHAEALTAPDSPIDATGVNLADLFHEPIYQLVRQQLLAHAREKDAAVPADVVRVLHVLSPHNTAYTRSYIAPGLKVLGESPEQVWTSLLRDKDRFVRVDPAVFLDPAITSNSYCDRYGR